MRKSTWNCIAVTAGVLAGSLTAQAAVVRYVNVAAAPGGNGTTWGSAYSEFQDALAEAAQAGSGITEIWLAQGTYRPDRGTGDTRAAFQMADGVDVYGGFAGNESDREARNPVTHPVILSGEIGTSALTDNSEKIIDIKSNVKASYSMA